MSEVWQRAVHFGFRLLYQEMAFTYDAVSWAVSMGAWRCWVESALRHLPPGEPVLELAHGPGHLQVRLAEQGVHAVGIDLSPQMGRQAQRRLAKQGHVARIMRARAQRLPFADAIFSAVVSTFPAEFIVQPETLAEVWRVLQPGAPLIIVPSAVFHSGGAAKTALEWAYRVTGQRDGQQAAGTGLAQYFEAHGFALDMFEEACPRSAALVLVARKNPSVAGADCATLREAWWL